MSFQTILTEQQGPVGLLTLNRPEKLNALNSEVMREMVDCVAGWDQDPSIRALLIQGSEKAFAAGADISEMVHFTYPQTYLDDFLTLWDRLAMCRKPIVAAVSGYALGGGCELMMMCDVIIASENARFGQPEIQLGVIPGIGGTQRLTRAIGKAKAMDLILTGRMMDAVEAERCGLISRIVPHEKVFEEALSVAQKIASFSSPAVLLAKETVDRAFETTLQEGVRFERRVFQALFGTEDQKEGMSAFLEKRPADFQGK